MSGYDALESAVSELGLQLEDTTFAAVASHLAMLRRWAPKINLVSKGDLPFAEVRHAADSLSLLRLKTVQAVTGEAIDVGSGAGFPGIPLAAARRDLQVTLLEPRQKRGAFLTQVLSHAGLNHVRWLQGRLPDDALNHRFDLVVSRATFPPEIIFERIRPLLKPNGIAAFMTSERTDLSPSARIIERDAFQLGDHVRHLTVAQSIDS